MEKRWDKENHWYELRPCSYYAAFENPILIYPDIAKESRWTFSNRPLFVGNTAYFIPSSELALLGIMNSKAVFFCYSKIATVLGDATRGGRLRWFTQDVVKIPIPAINESSRIIIERLVKQVLDAKSCSPAVDTSSLEIEIDQLVYQLYDLTEEEIAIIEKN